MRFEKWQALGNDYMIVEASELSFPLTASAVRRLCDRHTGPGADGVLELSPPGAPGHVARLRIFNPDGSEAELSGNGARQAIMYLRRSGATDRDEFSIQTAAGEIRAAILSETTCRMDLGSARLEGSGEVAGRAFQLISVGNPQCAIRIATRAELERLDLPAIGPAIEHDRQFPNRTNVSFWCATGEDAIRARIFERAVGETRSSGTGASGAAVAFVLQGGRSPVTVALDGGELTVGVGEDLRIDLTGWAVPIYRGELLEPSSAAISD
jgi:diaminopimelate epimerase